MSLRMEQSHINTIAQTVDSLYTERNSEIIKSTQSELLVIQKSEHGFLIADALLSNPSYSLNVQFFGALTYTVQLNKAKNDSSAGIEDISGLLERLLLHTKEKVRVNVEQNVSNGFIIKKLFQNISIIYASFNNGWRNPLKSLLELFGISDIGSLTPYMSTLLLDFTDILLGDFIRMGKSSDNLSIHEILQTEVYSLYHLIHKQNVTSGDLSLIAKSVESTSTWIQYITNVVEPLTMVRYKTISQDLIDPLVSLFQMRNADDQVFCGVASLLSDIFSENPTLLNYNTKDQINSLISNLDWTTGKVHKFVEEESFEGLDSLTDLIIAFFEINLTKFITDNLSTNSNILKFLLQFNDIPLHPVLQENVSRKLIDFWYQVLETFNDEFDVIETALHHDPKLISQISENSKSLAQSLSSIYSQKIQLSVLSEPEYSECKDEFQTFRQDAMELFDIIFSVIGPPLFESITQDILSSNKDINQMEAGLYILNSVSSNFSNKVDDRIVLSIKALFDYDFLTSYSDISNTVNFSDIYAKSCVRFLGTIDFVYRSELTKEYLNRVVEYLFLSLQTHPSQQFITSRALMDICNDCRNQLTSSISKFESILVEMISNDKINNYTREKFINAVSFIIQSIRDPETQENHVFNLIQLIETTISNLTQGAFNDEKIEYLLSLLNSIISVGKGLNLPDEFKEEDPESYQRFLSYYSKTYRVQNKLISLISKFDGFYFKEGFEKLLLIFKVGLIDEFGPFVFKTEDIISYTSTKLDLPDPDTTLTNILELINKLVAYRISKSVLFPPLTSEVINHIIITYVMSNSAVIEQDPYLLIASITLLTTISAHKQSRLFQNQDVLNFTVNICLKTLQSKEKFLIKATSKFWVTFITMKSLKSQEEADFVKNFIINSLGETLTLELFTDLIKSSRSDLEQYGNILVSLISKFQLQFGKWTELALIKISESRIQSGETPLEGKEVFLKKLLLTRGLSKKTNTILKDFWITTNGLVAFT